MQNPLSMNVLDTCQDLAQIVNHLGRREKTSPLTERSDDPAQIPLIRQFQDEYQLGPTAAGVGGQETNYIGML